MSILVSCPECGKELMAPEELLGKVAACPRCEKQFPVTAASKPPASNPGRAIFRGPPVSDSTTTDLLPPVSRRQTTEASGEKPPPDVKPAPQPKSQPIESPEDAVTSAHEPPPVPSAATWEAGPRWRGDVESNHSQKPAATRLSGATRVAQRARFVSAEPTSTPLRLGTDGELPTLRLSEGKQHDHEAETADRSNPILLIIALGISLMSTAALLFLDATPTESESSSKTEARARIEQYYTRPQPFLKPYQEHLRRALQAHHREDYATEQRLYRRVLDLLHSEGISENRGLTGQVKAAQPPNDEDLERLLSTLLSDA